MAYRLPLEPKLQSLIDRRRIAETMRKPRIFDVKQRTTGIDVKGLDAQIESKKFFKEKEIMQEKEVVEDMRYHERQQELKQKERDETAKQLAKELEQFRLTKQKPRDRRDFDLYDPDRLKKEKPVRTTDDDPQCSVSGLQKLVGEDLGGKSRRNLMKEQYRDMLLSQIRDNEERKVKEGEKTFLESLDWLADEEKAAMCEKKREEARFKEIQDNIMYNKKLAAEKKAENIRAGMRDQMDNLRDIQVNLNSNFLTKTACIGHSKGLSTGEKTCEELKRQIEESKTHKDKEETEQQEWADQQNYDQRSAILKDRSNERDKIKVQKELFRENLKLAEQQKIQNRQRNRILNFNPTEDYFTQFNTATR